MLLTLLRIRLPILLLLLLAMRQLQAQTVFTVNTAYDNADLSPGDGDCRTVTNGCSFRASIQEANETLGVDEIRIEFDIITGPSPPTPEDPVWSIQPGTALPSITRSRVTIDGETQTGAACGDLLGGTPHTLRVEIDGSFLSGLEFGVSVLSDYVVIRGLAIGGFPQYAVYSIGESTAVECSYLGISADGNTPAPNSRGFYVGERNFRIGGETTGAGNVISGNSNYAVFLLGADAIVKGNLIGLNALGDSAVPNGSGMYVEARGTAIGGMSPAARNYISGNNGVGIDVFPDAIDTEILGNIIGTNRTGTAALGNNRGINVYGDSTTIGLVGAGNVICGSNFYGIITYEQAIGTTIQANSVGVAESGAVLPNKYGVDANGDDVLVGGSGLGEGNVISGNQYYGLGVTASGSIVVERNEISDNGWDGVRVDMFASGQVDLKQNSIYRNDELGINLCPDPTCDSVTPNDPGDLDGVQNYPILSPLFNDGSPTVLVGFSLNSSPSSTFRVELFRSPAADPSGYGEGQEFIMSVTVSTDASGNASYLVPHDSGLFPVGSYITATATNPNGQTSEFSVAEVIDGPSVALNASVFFEGAFVGPGMSTTLNSGGHLPLVQPYGGPPWEYGGFETVTAFTPSIVDWVLVRLFAGNPAIPPMTLVASRAALLRNDAAIVDLDGISSLSFYAPAANYRIAVYHRNHLPVISSTNIALTETPTSYDFTSAMTQAFSADGSPMAALDGGVFGLYACNPSLDDIIQALDFDAILKTIVEWSEPGYDVRDCTLDGLVDNGDVSLFLTNTSLGATSQVP